MSRCRSHKGRCKTIKIGRRLLLNVARNGYLETLTFGIWLQYYTLNGCINDPSAYHIQHILLNRVSRRTCQKYTNKLVEYGMATLDSEKKVLVLKSFTQYVKQRSYISREKVRRYSPYENVRIPKIILDFTSFKRCVSILRVWVIATLQSNKERARQQIHIQDSTDSAICRQRSKSTRDYLDSMTAQGCTLSSSDEGMSLNYLAENTSCSIPTINNTNKLAKELGVYTTVSGGFIEIGMMTTTEDGNTEFVANPTLTEKEFNLGNRDKAFIWKNKVCVPCANRYELSTFTRTQCIRCRTIDGIECGTWEKRIALPFRKSSRRHSRRAPSPPTPPEYNKNKKS